MSQSSSGPLGPNASSENASANFPANAAASSFLRAILGSQNELRNARPQDYLLPEPPTTPISGLDTIQTTKRLRKGRMHPGGAGPGNRLLTRGRLPRKFAGLGRPTID